MKLITGRIINIKAGVPISIEKILKGFDENKEDTKKLEALMLALFNQRILYDKVSEDDWDTIVNKYNSLTGKTFVPSQEDIEKMLNVIDITYKSNPRQYKIGARFAVDLVLYYDPENERARRLQDKIELRSK